MDTDKLLGLVSKLKQEEKKRDRDDHILILDGLNTLIRAFSAVTTINSADN